MAATIVVIIILIVIVIFAGKSAIAHFRGEGDCCGGGGGDKREKPKKLDSVAGTRTLTVDGMHCEHCVTNVQNALNSLEHVSAKVNLRSKQAVVTYDAPIEDSVLRDVVRRAGYTVTDIR